MDLFGSHVMDDGCTSNLRSWKGECLRSGIKVLLISPQVRNWMISEIHDLCVGDDLQFWRSEDQVMSLGASLLEQQISVVHLLSLANIDDK